MNGAPVAGQIASAALAGISEGAHALGSKRANCPKAGAPNKTSRH